MTTVTPLSMPQQRPALDDVPLEQLRDFGRLAGQALADALERAVRHLRLAGASWSDVGDRLGVTRQSAWEKYRHVDAYGVRLVRDDDGRAVCEDEMTGHRFRDPQALGADAARVIEHQT